MNRTPTYHSSEFTHYRDLAREHLALSEAELRERVADLTSDVASHRLVTQTCLAALHHVTTERGRLRTENRQLRERVRQIEVERTSAVTRDGEPLASGIEERPWN
jgi:regulator of replication initiation timing